MGVVVGVAVVLLLCLSSSVCRVDTTSLMTCRLFRKNMIQCGEDWIFFYTLVFFYTFNFLLFLVVTLDFYSQENDFDLWIT